MALSRIILAWLAVTVWLVLWEFLLSRLGTFRVRRPALTPPGCVVAGFRIGRRAA